jgi:two-component system nitrogen regulation sensor histidine kinase NtrY
MTIQKRFRLQVILRILMLSATIYTFIYFYLQSNKPSTTIIIIVFVLYQVYSLIRYVEKTNRDLTRFLQSIKYDDYSQSFSSSGLGTSFDELNKTFSELMRKLRQVRSEKEEQYRYLQTVIQHVGIGLIAFKQDGRVDLINTSAKRLLNVVSLKNIKGLETFSQELVDTLFQLKPGGKSLVKVGNISELQQLAIYATEFRLREQKYTLVSLQNIHGELEEKEMEAWQTLIRVLTHEIMNSMTPISSLSATVIDLLKSPDEDEDKIPDIQKALETIHKRSLGLTHFVSAYRNLALIPSPKFKMVQLDDLFHRINDLMKNKFQEKNICFELTVDPETLELTADPVLVEQVLINLLMNSAEALKDIKDPRIKMEAELGDNGRVLIRIIDNGAGIVEEALKKIFIPFFTTKRKGSGIGLSLSRQIMRLHQGTISAQSEPDEQTIFTLKF